MKKVFVVVMAIALVMVNSFALALGTGTEIDHLLNENESILISINADHTGCIYGDDVVGNVTYYFLVNDETGEILHDVIGYVTFASESVTDCERIYNVNGDEIDFTNQTTVVNSMLKLIRDEGNFSNIKIIND